MLQEILEHGYVDPELLEQLGDEQKEVLFRKMREEQVQRWRSWDGREGGKRAPGRTRRRLKRKSGKVNFNVGADGQPWVWVMGEHKNDLPYDKLVRMREQEEQEKEKMSDLQDRQDAEEVARQEAEGILAIAKQFGEVLAPGFRAKGAKAFQEVAVKVDSPDTPITGSATSGEPVKTSQYLRVARTESHSNVAAEVLESPNPQRRNSDEIETESRRRTLVRKASIIGTSKVEQQRFEKERAEELYYSLKRAKKIAKDRSQEMSQNVETWWREAERKAKDFEHSRRNSIRMAKELITKSPDISEKILEHIPEAKQKEFVRRMSIHRSSPPPGGGRAPSRSRHKPVRPAPSRSLVKRSSVAMIDTTPKSTAHIMRWFVESEAPKGVGREKDGSISVWFHGKLDREHCRRLLDCKPVGSYLVRLSTKVWGYTVSVKTYTDCKHFLVDASSGRYRFVGPKQQDFATIPELLKFYRVNPVTWAGQEVLLLPVGQEEEVEGLFTGLYNTDDTFEESDENTTL